MKIYKQGSWQYWYDKAYRCWFAAQFDTDGNQIGDSINAYSKQEILNEIERGE